MNSSNLMHAVYAVLMQAVVAFALFAAHKIAGPFPVLVWCAVAGAFAGSFFFLGREHGLQERKLGGPFLTRWWEGFTGWGRDQFGDVVGPVIGCGALLVVIYLIARV